MVDDMDRVNSGKELLRASREVLSESRTGARSVQRLLAHSEVTIAASWTLLRKLERLEAEFFDRTPKRDR